jgi:aspartyl-tRNA(Asn)/glutamyl-tRNA(Gln) amidotransferase subunit C
MASSPDSTQDRGGIHDGDIEKIARLARISVDAAEVGELTRRLGNILALVDELKSVDTTGITPMANPHDAVQRLRPDEVTEPNQREAFQAIAPLTEAGLYLVPKVIE